VKRVTIAIDGPAASGKTTTARELARRLSYRYLDSGAAYRALALKASRRSLDVFDPDALDAMLATTSIAYDDEGRLVLDGVVESAGLRTPEVAEAASRLSVLPIVRSWVNERLRDAARGGGVVMEGRDIGTVVLPNAEVKVFLQARLPVRAERRRRELAATGRVQTIERVEGDLVRRDERDSQRAEAPLRSADGAVVLDGSDLGFEEQVEAVLALVTAKAT
jgi:cytidylate kinase